MNRARIRDLALVAVASGLLVFEVTSLKNALPATLQAFAPQAAAAGWAEVSAAKATATQSVLRVLGSAASNVALGAVKEAARRFGTVTPPAPAEDVVLLAITTLPVTADLPARLAADRQPSGAKGPVVAWKTRHARVLTVSTSTSKSSCRSVAVSRSVHPSESCREVESRRRRTTS